MFLPVESLLSDILKEDSELIEHGIRQNVLIATPINFIAILKSIHFSWRQEAMVKNAKEIGEAGRDVVIVLEDLMSRFRSFWKELENSIKKYKTIDKFINDEALPIANKLKTLGIEVNEEKTDAIDNT
jgi:DNA recombination protein RmuC